MARKGWDSLSDGYRARLQKGGISRSAYERGESLAKARGHERTPERPSQPKLKERYPNYFNERQKLINDVVAKKQEYFGTSPKWNPKKARANLSKYPPPMALLRWALDATYEEWIDAIHNDPEQYAWLGYH